ncbi:SagB family peptide dehydrogenase [Pseudomonas neuropathica]|uniref:SagB family peptide dehydrogenase n=1 Tax=Pseudomonas neuropathica TaxID=2730425 RepID=UPI003EB6F43B
MIEAVVNQDIIITVSSEKIGLWNLISGEQYEIYERSYWARIFELVSRPDLLDFSKSEDVGLYEAGLILINEDARNYERNLQSNGNWGWDQISRIFHLGSKHITMDDGVINDTTKREIGYLNYCESIFPNIPEIEIEREGELIELPPYDGQAFRSETLEKTLRARSTSRKFVKDPISLQAVANILYMTFGKIHGDLRKDEMEQRGLVTVGYRRSSPSAGSLQATEAYIIVQNVEGLAAGVYHYRSHQHKLTLLSTDLTIPLDKALCYQDFALDAGLLVILTSRFDKLWWKYPHSRAYRSALMDVGHLSQTFNLVTTAHGLNTWLTGFFIDDLLNQQLRIDSHKEHTIFVLAAGHGAPDPVNPGIELALASLRA